jgi:hypothetical protein
LLHQLAVLPLTLLAARTRPDLVPGLSSSFPSSLHGSPSHIDDLKRR